MSRRRFLAAGMALAASTLARPAGAQAFPTKPIRLMVGYPPGGLPDTTARLLAQRMTESLGQQVLIENRPGAGGSLACEVVAKASPDGYTLLIADLGQAAINLALYPNLPYDTLRDFAPITSIGNSPFFLAAYSGSGIATWRDLVQKARANPGRITYGSSGNGSPAHLATEILKSISGLDLVHVPFKGSGQSLPALISGQVDLLFTVLPTTAAAVKAGQVKLIGVASDQRSSQAPDVPSFAELGVQGMRMTPSVSLLAPAATPKPIVALLSAEAVKAIRHPETLKRFAALGIDPIANSPEAYAAELKADVAYFGRAVKATGMKID
jgi:tripartite-type tricarboxylate transporter receptor subunit TctC